MLKRGQPRFIDKCGLYIYLKKNYLMGALNSNNTLNAVCVKGSISLGCKCLEPNGETKLRENMQILWRVSEPGAREAQNKTQQQRKLSGNKDLGKVFMGATRSRNHKYGTV